MALPVPRAALGIIGMPPVPVGPPGMAGVSPATAGSAVILALGNTELNDDGAAEVQLCGTESRPIEAARPAPAATWTLPMLGAAKKPVPELKPLPAANPNVWNWLPKTPAAGLRDCANELDEPIDHMPKVDIGAAEPVPTRLAADENAADEAVHDDSDDEDDVDEAAETSPDNMFVPVAVVSGDIIEPSWPDITEPSWPDITELSWLDIIALIWPEIIELSWPDIIELSSLEITEPIGPDNKELSGPDTTELSGPDIAELTV